jgi:hypothetical protein
MSGQNYSVISAARSRIMASVHFMGRHASLTELRSVERRCRAIVNRPRHATEEIRRSLRLLGVRGPPSGISFAVSTAVLGSVGIVMDLRLCYANECGSRFEWSPRGNRFDIQYATLGHG